MKIYQPKNELLKKCSDISMVRHEGKFRVDVINKSKATKRGSEKGLCQIFLWYNLLSFNDNNTETNPRCIQKFFKMVEKG